MTEEEVFDRVVAYLRKINSDAKVIDPAYANLEHIRRSDQTFVPRPGAGPYASLNMLSRRDIAELECFTYAEDEVEIDGESYVVMGHVRAIEWLFRVDIFASNPTDVAGLFQTALRSDARTGGLLPLIVRQVDNIPRMGQITQQRWEGRAHLSFTVIAPVVEKMLIDTIETVGGINVTGTPAQGSSLIISPITP